MAIVDEDFHGVADRKLCSSFDSNIPVTIRYSYKALKNGNQSIYLDCYLGGGQREYKFLNLYLRPGKTREDKEWNKSQMELATAIKFQYIVDIQNGVYGFKDLNRTRKLNFIDFLQRMSDDYTKPGRRPVTH